MTTRRALTLSSILVLCTMLGAIASSPAPGGGSDQPEDGPVRLAQGAQVGGEQDGGEQDAGEGTEDGKKDGKKEEEKLTLERLFPEKSYWGPSARSMAFSRDGRYGAFLYRPFLERRHGYDLYIYDTQTGKTRRMTSVGRMAEYEADTREVRDDREKKAKQAGVTLDALAREQAATMGWDDDVPLGSWTGDATASGQEGQEGPEGQEGQGGGAIPPGPCELSIEIGKGGALHGEVRVWLVRLPVREGSFDRGAGTLEAEVADEKLGVRGKLALKRDGEKLVGDLTLEEPAITLALELTPKQGAEEDSEKPAPPRGVIGAIGERLTLGDVVLEDDAEINDEKDGKRPDKPAPRYGGVQGFEWSPVASEMLLLSGGDVYRLTIDEEAWNAAIERPAPVEPEADETPGEAAGETPAGEAEAAGEDGDAPPDAEAESDGAGADQEAGEDAAAKGSDEAEAKKKKAPELKPVIPYRGTLTRLTRTQERESDVQYMPDGTGYTYLRGGALLAVGFGDHRIIQLDPELKDGERMVSYKISPDQKRLVFLANRGDNYWGTGRQVTIVNYRDRFARAEQVTRHMSDDPWPEAYSSVYLYDLTGHEKEEGTLERVFTKRITGPRDILRVPEWSPDSSRVAFAAFEQSTNLIKILEAGFVDEKKKAEEEAAAADAAAEAKGEDGEGKDDGGDGDGDGDGDVEKEDGTSDTKQGGGTTQEGEPAKDGAEAEEEKPEFKIENARVVYEFLHFGGPNTPGMVQPQYLPDSRRIVFMSELSGYRQLHLLEPRYQQLRQLTEGRFEVYPFEMSEDHTRIYAVATREDPNQEQVYAIDTESGEMTRLSTESGVYSGAAVSDDGAHVLANRVDFGAPGELVAIATGENAVSRVMTESHPPEAHKLTTVIPEYFTYENRQGQEIHGHMFKPRDWTPEDRRPLLIYVYGGPLGEEKMATRGSFNTSSYMFARYMTENHGYVTATIDPRGASGYGAVFEKANFEQVGKPQTEDLVDGARWLVKHAGVDEKRMGLHGWSFGGFQTQMVMYTEPEVFAAGIAGAGPTEWENYNSWYSSGTIGQATPGKVSLDKYSLLPLAKNIKGHLLLIHGMEDSNVLYQDTVRVYRELLKAGKEVNVELFLDPTGGHGLGGDVKTIGRFRKYEDFLLRYLGVGKAAEKKAEAAEEPPADPAEPAGAEGAGDAGAGEQEAESGRTE